MHGSTVVLVALLTSAATATGTTYLIERYDVFSRRAAADIAAPSLEGLSEADARANAQALKLALLVESREATAEGKPGTVLRQSVGAGERISVGSAVGVVIAEALPAVPNVVGMALPEAQASLVEAGYAVQVGEAVPAATAAGTVVRQTPRAERGLARGGEVTLVASSGPKELETPKVTGLSLKAARQKLEALGLSADVKWISRAETVTYVVLGQKPKPGEPIAPEGSVEVVINR